MKRFAPDFDEDRTLEVPNFRREAQQLLQLISGPNLTSYEYTEKLEVIEIALKKVYQAGSALSKIDYEGQLLAIRAKMEQTQKRTLRPKKPTDPGIGIPLDPDLPKGIK